MAKSVWLEWEETESGTWTSSDNDGNKYFMPANQETCTVRSPDGYEGFGWTPEDALSDALSKIEKLLEVEQEREAEINNRSSSLKCSPEVAEYIIGLERRLSRLDDKIDMLWFEYRTT